MGFFSSVALFVVGVAYALITAAGMIASGLDEPITGPVLTAMEALTLGFAPLLVVRMAALQSTVADDKKVYGTLALSFAIVAASLTAAVHFISLTSLRQTGEQLLAWPSPLYAVELLAWDVFLGLTLIATAKALSSRQGKIRNLAAVTGILCLAGTSGPITGEMRLQFIAVVAYGLLLPALWLMMAVDLRRRDKSSTEPRDKES